VHLHPPTGTYHVLYARCYVNCYASRKLFCEVVQIPRVTSRTRFSLTNATVHRKSCLVLIDDVFGIEESDRTMPGNEPFLVLLSWVIVILRSVSPSWDQTGTLDSAPELVLRKRGSPSTVSTWSLQASSRLSSSRTLRNTNFAHFALTQVCVCVC